MVAVAGSANAQVLTQKDTIGAIGVSGAPGQDKDEACAQAGLAKVADQLQ